MSSKSLIAIAVGTVVLFVSGYLIYGLALAGFYESNVGTATGVQKDINFLWLILATVASAALLTVVLGWAGSTDVASGFKNAALVGLLMGFAIELGFYSMTNLHNLTITLVDPFIGAIYFGIGGAVIGLMLGRGDTA